MSNEKPLGLTARQKIQKGMTITREKIVPIEFDESRYEKTVDETIDGDIPYSYVTYTRKDRT